MSGASKKVSTRVDIQDLAPVNLVASMPAALRGYVESVISQIDGVANDQEALWQISARGEEMEMAGRLIAGKANLELSTRVDNISEELRRRGKNRGAFFHSIDIYRAYEALPNTDSVASLARLGHTKCRAMLSWSPDERLELACGKKVRGLTIDDAADMTTRQFEEATKKPARDAELEKANKRAEKAESELEVARRMLAQRDETKAPLDLLVAGEEAMALSTTAIAAIEAAKAVFRERVKEESDDKAWREEAGSIMYFALLPVAMSAVELIEQIARRIGPLYTKGLRPEFRLPKGSVAHYLAIREELLDSIPAEARERTAARQKRYKLRGRHIEPKAKGDK